MQRLDLKSKNVTAIEIMRITLQENVSTIISIAMALKLRRSTDQSLLFRTMLEAAIKMRFPSRGLEVEFEFDDSRCQQQQHAAAQRHHIGER